MIRTIEEFLSNVVEIPSSIFPMLTRIQVNQIHYVNLRQAIEEGLK